MTDRSTDKLSKITMMFILWIIFIIISFFIVRKLDNSSDSSFIFAIADMSNMFAQNIIEAFNKLLIQKDIILSEQMLINITFAFKVYWMSSTLTGYCVLTYFMGIGILQLAIKLVFCPLISPLVMPIVILIAVISFIKNIIILIKN